ncbi:MAG: redoxin domain-containing protein [Proteobacteria bacterium]|nr:redoxin domain-containing protein [Pseudomonadota bacterium]
MILTALLFACATPETDEVSDDTAAEDTVEGLDGAAVSSCTGTLGLEVGDCAPDFTLTSSLGEERSLADYSGQPVLIVGSASW